MIDRLDEIKKKALASLEAAKTDSEIEEIYISTLGRNGKLTEILRGMGKLSKEMRAEVGKMANIVKQELEEGINSRRQAMAEMAQQLRFEREKIDVTEPGKHILPSGHLHPLTLVYREIRDALVGMGFTTFDGPEIEYDDLNFTKLNMPPEDRKSVV